MCSSPKLFAAYHVLHRPPMPRHPSCALSSLTTKKLVVSTTSGIAPGSSNSSLQLSLNISCLRGPNINCFMFKLSYSCRIFFKTFSSIVKTARAARGPRFYFNGSLRQNRFMSSNMVEPKGLEPSTSCLQSRYSNQLSYGPVWRAPLPKLPARLFASRKSPAREHFRRLPYG